MVSPHDKMSKYFLDHLIYRGKKNIDPDMIIFRAMLWLEMLGKEREMITIIHRHNLDGNGYKTFKYIAGELGRSVERTRRIYLRAISFLINGKNSKKFIETGNLVLLLRNGPYKINGAAKNDEHIKSALESSLGRTKKVEAASSIGVYRADSVRTIQESSGYDHSSLIKRTGFRWLG